MFFLSITRSSRRRAPKNHDGQNRGFGKASASVPRCRAKVDRVQLFRKQEQEKNFEKWHQKLLFLRRFFFRFERVQFSGLNANAAATRARGSVERFVGLFQLPHGFLFPIGTSSFRRSSARCHQSLRRIERSAASHSRQRTRNAHRTNVFATRTNADAPRYAAATSIESDNYA